MKPIIQQIIDAAGGISPLITATGADPGLIVRWQKIPQKYLVQIEAVTGMPARALRPDLFLPKRADESMDEAARNAMLRALDEAGGGAALGRAIGIQQSSVCIWKKVPALRVLDVERVTGVPRYELRPDIYPTPDRSLGA